MYKEIVNLSKYPNYVFINHIESIDDIMSLHYDGNIIKYFVINFNRYGNDEIKHKYAKDLYIKLEQLGYTSKNWIEVTCDFFILDVHREHIIFGYENYSPTVLEYFENHISDLSEIPIVYHLECTIALDYLSLKDIY